MKICCDCLSALNRSIGLLLLAFLGNFPITENQILKWLLFLVVAALIYQTTGSVYIVLGAAYVFVTLSCLLARGYRQPGVY